MFPFTEYNQIKDKWLCLAQFKDQSTSHISDNNNHNNNRSTYILNTVHNNFKDQSCIFYT